MGPIKSCFFLWELKFVAKKECCHDGVHLSYQLFLWCRKEGQDTQEELQKRNLREELEERERRHFASKDKSYAGIKIILEPFFPFLYSCCLKLKLLNSHSFMIPN